MTGKKYIKNNGIEDGRLFHQMVVVVSHLPGTIREPLQVSGEFGILRLDIGPLHRRDPGRVHPDPNNECQHDQRQSWRQYGVHFDSPRVGANCRAVPEKYKIDTPFKDQLRLLRLIDRKDLVDMVPHLVANDYQLGTLCVLPSSLSLLSRAR